MEHKIISTQNNIISCAQFGYGYFGKIINSYILNNPQLSLQGIYWPSQIHGAADIYSQNVQNMLNDPSVSVIFIITPLKTHFQLALMALSANKHVFIEKPTCLTYEETAYLNAFAQERDLVLFTDYTFAYSPSIQLLAKDLQENTIGEIFSVKLRMLQWGRFGRESAVVMLGSHLLSIISILFPENLITFQNVLTNKEVKEEAKIQLLLDDVIPVEVQVSLLNNERIRDGVVQGEKGTLKYQLQAQSQWTYARQIKNSEPQYLKFDEQNTLRYSIFAFLQTIRQRENKNKMLSLRVASILDKIHETFK